jgi:hypothetical protein
MYFLCNTYAGNMFYMLRKKQIFKYMFLIALPKHCKQNYNCIFRNINYCSCPLILQLKFQDLLFIVIFCKIISHNIFVLHVISENCRIDIVVETDVQKVRCLALISGMGCWYLIFLQKYMYTFIHDLPNSILMFHQKQNNF